MLVLVASLLQAVATFGTPATPAHAAEAGVFDPGRIIDDSIFFNGDAMTARQVQDFLETKVSTCQAGYTCLKDLRLDTTNKPADQMCAGYTGRAYQSAADVIAAVGRSCGISQKVLLVTLQKEQGLVTHTWPSEWRYMAAMGQGCPDTAACNEAYYGFFNQVYGAAHQMKRYANPPGTSNFFTWYAPGRTWNVLFHPNTACGSSPVYIQNQATADLYYYTPYQPNRAALAAGYGTGDACSSYGNRNFFNYFTAWFGSTKGYDVGGEFADYFAANRAWLGYTTGPMTCTPTGCSQSFQGGMVFRSAAGVHGVRNEYLASWGNYGREFGVVGYPTSEVICVDMGNACRQEFQGGWLVQNSSIGVRYISSAFLAVWFNWGREYGAMGLPISDAGCSADGVCLQAFKGAWIVQHASVGARVVPNSVFATWSDWGRQGGTLALPIADPSVPGGADFIQSFQGGTVTVQAHVGRVSSTVDPWFDTVIKSPWLGAAQGSQSCTLGGGGCYQAFQGGWMVKSDVGSFAVPNAVRDTWMNWGRNVGVLGFPKGAPSADPASGNYTQQFQGGVITVSGGVGRVSSTVDPWFDTVIKSPWLGAAQGSQSCTLGGGGCYQAFQGGWMVKSDVGSFAVPNAVRDTWMNWGRNVGVLGFPKGAPSADPASGNYTQQFQGGVITVSGGVGRVSSTVDPWFDTVIKSPWLGAAQGSQSCTLGGGGCYQAFQGGWMVKSDVGSFAVPNAVRDTWMNWGRNVGVLGFPKGAPSADPASGNYTQQFQGGVITVSGGVGRVSSTVDPWFDTVIKSPWLGAAQGSQSCTLGGGGCYQAFQGGWMVKSDVGSFAVPNAVRDTWMNWGRNVGVLGFPKGAPSADPASGNYTQQFQGGVITVSGGVGRYP